MLAIVEAEISTRPSAPRCNRSALSGALVSVKGTDDASLISAPLCPSPVRVTLPELSGLVPLRGRGRAAESVRGPMTLDAAAKRRVTGSDLPGSARPTTSPTTFFAHAASWPETVGLTHRVNGTWTPVTWHEFAGQVRDVAEGFIAAGIQPGDGVGLMSRTRYEWTLVDFAILTAGGVTVPIYPTSSLEQVEWILGDSGAVAIVAETDEHAEMVTQARAKLPALKYLWVIAGRKFDGLAEATSHGVDVSADHVEERRATRGADDLGEIVYTSGTTGRPKGCMLSHGNIVANAYNCMQNDGFKRVFTENHSTLL